MPSSGPPSGRPPVGSGGDRERGGDRGDAAATARTDEAVRHFEEAIAVNARMDGRHWLAHAQDDSARLLAARGRPADAARVHELLTACAGTYRELDMGGYAAEAGRLLAAG